MYPSRFDYLRAGSLAEAVETLSVCGDRAAVLAGGQSLIPLMKLRLSRPACIVDISRLSELAYIRTANDCLELGALTRHADILEAPTFAARWSILRDAARVIGDVQVRNIGTVGGALAEADPAGDWGPVFLALRGEIRCAGPRGERVVRAEDFFLDAFTPALEGGEVITEIRVPDTGCCSGGAYSKLEVQPGGYAVASVAVQLQMDGKWVRCCTIGLGGVGTTPLRARRAEEMLVGQLVSETLVSEVIDAIQEEADPVDDIRGSADYRRAMLGPLTTKSLSLALARASSSQATRPESVPPLG